MSKELVVKKDFTKNQIQLITNTIAKGASQDELKLFLYIAQKTGLDPLARQIHFVKRGGQMVVQTGIDGYRAVASRSGELAGIDDAIYDDETEAHPNKATVTVWRNVSGERVAFTASARWSEYAPKDVKVGFMWAKMPFLMLGKCAEALALRKAFPNDLSGIYTDEEMAQAENAHTTPIQSVSKKAPKKISVVSGEVKKDSLLQAGLKKIELEKSIDRLSEFQMKIAETDVYNDEEKEQLYKATEKRIEELSDSQTHLDEK